jgi:hypothetical protein
MKRKTTQEDILQRYFKILKIKRKLKELKDGKKGKD